MSVRDQQSDKKAATVVVITGHGPIEDRSFQAFNENEATTLRKWLNDNGIGATVMTPEAHEVLAPVDKPLGDLITRRFEEMDR